MTTPWVENILLSTFLSSKVGNLRSKIVYIQVVSITSGTEESQFNVKYSVVFLMFIRASLYKRREENQLDATEWLIALTICSTCFGHL